MRNVTYIASGKAKAGLKSLFFTLIIVPLLATGMFVAGPAWAVHDDTNFDNIELEGNSENDGGAVEGIDDWDDVYADCLLDPINCTPVSTGALRQTWVREDQIGDLPDDTDYTTFPGGKKDIQPVADWTCEGGTPQGKSDILHASGATYVEADGDLVFYGQADRRTTDGESYYGIWLFQKPVGCDSESNAGAVTPFTGTKTHGDLLLVADLLQGGTVSEILAYVWTDLDGTPNSGDECVGNGIDCTNANKGVPIDLIPLGGGGNCSDGVQTPDGDVACAITNEGVTPIDLAWRTGVEQNGFFEAGSNLTQLIGEIQCFATAMIETRSSPSLTASLKDFVFLDLATCGTLDVVKETIGGNGTFGFSAPGLGGPDAFDLTVPGTPNQFFPTVEPGTYTISEISLPAGPAAPDGWNLTGIECLGGTDPGSVTILDPHAGGSVEIDFDANDDVVCTFTNTFTPPSGTITIEKVCDSVDDGGQTFDFTLVGFGGSTTLNCADGSITLDCDAGDATYPSSVTCETLIAGDYMVNETVPAGWELTDVSCTGTSTCGPAETPDATISLPAGGAETATFTNTENAGIIICKDTLPPGTGGDFTFNSAEPLPAEFFLADGQCTDDGEAGPFVVTPGVSYDITELPEVDFTLANISCTCDGGQCDGDDWSALGGTVTITPDAGETVTCSFSNTENPGYIQICKNTVTTSGANPAFTMNLMGPDADLQPDGVSSALIHGECDFGLGDSGQVDLTAGAGYSVSEDAAAGWDTEVACVGSGGAEDPNNIDVAPNEQVVCTFTNTERGTIIVEKQTLPDGSPATFDFGGSLVGTIGDGGEISLQVMPAQYSTTETVPGGWDLTDITCDDGNSSGDVGTATATYNVEPGETVRCVFTNTQRGNIEVEKQTLPDGSPQTFEFAGDLNGFIGDGGVLSAEVVPGVYGATETVPGGWDLTSIVCNDGNSSGAGPTATYNVEPGETVRCVFTNTIQNGNIVVVKQTDPDGSTASFDFTTNYGGGGFSLQDNQSNNSGQLLPSSEAGAYSVAETGLPAGWSLDSASCDDGSPPIRTDRRRASTSAPITAVASASVTASPTTPASCCRAPRPVLTRWPRPACRPVGT
jgi:hypothetical protein